MKAIHTYNSIENKIEVMKDGSIEIDISNLDDEWCQLTVETKDAERIYEALKSVFDPTTPA